MQLRPRFSLGRVLDDLGATLLDLVHGDVERVDEIGGVVIHDPLEEPFYPRDALVLGVGVSGEAGVEAMLHRAGAHQAAALVVREPVTLTPAIRAASDGAGVALLALSRGATWSQLAALLSSILGDVGVTDAESLGGLPSGDLFAVANAVAALLDAPVTIEDRSSRVIAFSGRQEQADPSRVETILGRQVPERFSRRLADQGVFRALYRSDRPVVVAPPEDDADFSVPRIAVAVRAGDEVLGSIWAASWEPLTPERAEAMGDAAKLAALHLLRVRAGSDVERRLSSDLVGTALEGGVGSHEALGRLGLAGQSVLVLGVVRSGDGEEAAAVVVEERRRLGDALALHLMTVSPGSAAAVVGDVVYGLVPVPRDAADADERGQRILTEFVDRLGSRVPALAAVGSVAADVAGLSHARSTVDRVLRVLRQGRGSRRVARLADVQTETLLLDLRDLAASRGDAPTGAVSRLIDYDSEHGTSLVTTLRAWLDAFGDVASAADSLYVHPNTFRYRLRRMTAVAGLDLTDPDVRFATMLQLRMLDS